MARKQRALSPMEELKALEGTIQSGGGPPCGVILRGDERYFRSRGVALLREAAEGKSWEVVSHDGKDPDFSLSALIDDLSGTGLFAAERLVIARNVEQQLRASEGGSSLTRALVTWLGSDAPPGGIVLDVASLRADHAVAKAVKKAGGVLLSCRKLWDGPPPWDPDPRKSELVQWIVGRSRELGIPLKPDSAVYLAAATGNDPFALDDCIGAIRDQRPGTREEFMDAVPWDASAAPWDVADRILDGNLARSVSGLHGLFEGGFIERDGKRLQDSSALALLLVGSLTRGVRQGLALAEERAAGADPREAAARAGVSGPPRSVEAALSRSARRGVEDWRRLVFLVADLERSLKTGGGADLMNFTALALTCSVRPA